MKDMDNKVPKLHSGYQ